MTFDTFNLFWISISTIMYFLSHPTRLIVKRACPRCCFSPIRLATCILNGLVNGYDYKASFPKICDAAHFCSTEKLSFDRETLDLGIEQEYFLLESEASLLSTVHAFWLVFVLWIGWQQLEAELLCAVEVVTVLVLLWVWASGKVSHLFIGDESMQTVFCQCVSHSVGCHLLYSVPAYISHTDFWFFIFLHLIVFVSVAFQCRDSTTWPWTHLHTS